MYYMCGGNVCRLPYLGQRYDAETFAKLNALLATNKIEWGEKKLFPAPRLTLCKSPLTRKKINAARYEQESKGKETVFIDGVAYFVGMPLIAYDNDKTRGIVNSHHYILVDANEGGAVVLRNQHVEQTVRVPDASISKLFRYGWCDTVARVQGGALDFPYNIVDLASMNRNDLYTAVSRTTRWEYIGVDVDTSRKEYLPASYPFQCRELDPASDIQEHVIYEKRFVAPDYDAGARFYIGRTNNEEKREEQHKQKPISKEMAEALARPHVTNVIARWVCTKHQIDTLETEMIRAALLAGDDLRNKKKVKGIKPTEPVAVVKHTVVITNYPILDDTTRQSYHIRWGKQKKEFRYARCGKEAAYKKAEAFRNNLIKEMLL